LGALAAGLPALLVGAGLSPASGTRLLFGAYAVLGLVVAGLSLRLSSPVEAPVRPPIEAKRLGQRLAPQLHRSRGIVWRLTALFSVDALAGGLVALVLLALRSPEIHLLRLSHIPLQGGLSNHSWDADFRTDVPSSHHRCSIGGLKHQP
jgi:hypothetical protein